MNILVINWQDIRNPLGGGAEVHLHQVFSRIATRGHTVTVLCSMFPGGSAEEVIDGLSIVRRGSRGLFNFVAPGAYREMQQRETFDIVVDDMNKIPFLAQRYAGVPVYGIVHHLFGTSIFREVNPITASYVSWMERRALQRYRKDEIPFIAVSPSTRDDMIRRGYPASLLSLVSLAVDHQQFRPGGVLKSADPVIGYVGRIKRYKSIDHLIEAFPRVLASFPGAKLLIIGEGDDRSRLERIVDAKALRASVEFTGFVDEATKVRLLQSMWALVMPSSKEGWGLTVTEANACGTPAVVTNVPGLRDAVVDQETGFVVPYGDRVALAEAITKLLANRDLRTRMGTRAEEFSKQFSWDIAAEKTLALLTATVQQAATAGD